MAVLIGLCLAVYLPGLFTTPPIDRDEARFAQASRQMFESMVIERPDTTPLAVAEGEVLGGFHAGGLVVPMVQHVPRLNKPPLIYWLQSASAWAFTGGDPLHDAIWMYRIPSVLGSMLAVLSTYWIGRRMFAGQIALFGASLLAVSAVVIFDAHQARADQVLLGLTTLAMGILWSMVRRARQDRSIGMLRWLGLWAVVGLGVLVKGVSPVVVLSTIAALLVVGRMGYAWRSTKPLIGLVVVALVVLPWVFALTQRVGLDTYISILFDETVARGSKAKEGHVGPPGYHTAFLWAMFWPGSLAVLPGLWWGARRAIRLGPQGSRVRARVAGDHRALFLMCWIVPTWLFFELYATKLPHYVLPTYPAVALLSARAIASRGVPRRLKQIGVGVFALVGIGVPIAAVVMSASLEFIRPGLWLIVPAAMAMVVLVGVATRRAWGGQVERAGDLAVFAMLPLVWIVHVAVIPRLTTFSPELVTRLAEYRESGRPLGCMGYHEDSLIFLMRGEIERVVHTDSVEWLDANPGGMLLARRLYREEAGLGESYRTLESHTGFQFASSDTVTVDFVEKPE